MITLKHKIVSKIITFAIFILVLNIISGCGVNIEIEPQRNTNNFSRIFDELYYRDFMDFPEEETPNEQTNTQNNQNNGISAEQLIFGINIDTINSSTSRTIVAGVGTILDIYKGNDIIMKVIVKDIISGNDVILSINNQRSMSYQKDTILRIRDSHYMQISEIYYHNELSKAGIVFNLYSLDREQYPDILIEEDIGLHRYQKSLKIESNLYEINSLQKENDENINETLPQNKTHSNISIEKYVAVYGKANVSIIKNTRFVSLFNDNRNVIEYNGYRIYQSRDYEKVAWVSFWEGIEHIIIVNGYYNSIINAYLEKYPSHISAKTFCDRDIWLQEGEEWTEFFNDYEIEITLDKINPVRVEANLIFNSNHSMNLTNKEVIKINDTFIILDTIEINPRDRNRIRVCFA